MITPLDLLVNGVALALVVVITLLMARSVNIYNKNNGDGDIQDAMKWRILRLILLLIFIAFATAGYNLLKDFFLVAV